MFDCVLLRGLNLILLNVYSIINPTVKYKKTVGFRV